jgi:hypothetical protein
MKQVLFLWLVTSVFTPHVRAECYGDKEFVFSLGCSQQFLDCESCVIGTILNPSCNGWCEVAGRCSGSLEDCPDGEVAYEDWCPADTVNPAFDNQDCIAVSWEQYICTQEVDTIGCDENYVMNYCSLDNQTSTQLCNGEEIKLINWHYLPELGGRGIGMFQKNPAGVRVQFGPGSGLYTSACYKFNYDPITDAIVCAAGDTFALKYTLALQGSLPPEPAPTDLPSPVAPPTTDAPVATPDSPTIEAPVLAPIAEPTSVSQTTIQPSVMSPVFLPTQPPTSAAHGAGLSTFLSASLLFVWCSPTEI